MATSAVLPAPSGITTGEMLASIPADIMSAFSSSPSEPGPVDESIVDDEPADTAPTEDAPQTVLDEPTEDAAPDAEPVEETPATPAEDKPAADVKAAADEELPEGVSKGKDRKGKPGYFLEEGRYKSVYGNHQLTQQAADILGEPLTVEGIQLRHDALLANDRLFNDLTSGDPTTQARVVGEFIKEMKGAMETGEVGSDPTVPFAQTVYSALKEGSPDGYANLRLLAARDLLTEMYEDADAANDLNLYYSAQRFSTALSGVGPKPASMSDQDYGKLVQTATDKLGIPFHGSDKIGTLAKREDPVAKLTRENAELKAKIEGRTTTGTAAQYDTWWKESVKAVNEAVVSDVVQPALASVADGWKQFPDDYRRLVSDPLNREVSKAVREDAGLNRQLGDLQARAKRAASEQVRTRIGSEIKSLILNRAKLAAEKAKGPIIKFAADSLKGRSDTTHERRSGAQTRTAPQGQSAPVKHSAVPDLPAFKDGVFDSSAAVKMAARLMSA